MTAAPLVRVLPPWLDRAEYPFAPRSFETPEGRMSYLDEGSGPVVLFVHGTPSWSFEWRHVIRALAGSARCIAPDHLGFGLSDKPRDPGVLRPVDHARRLRALVRALDLRDVTLVVHDFGGPIGLPLAWDEPDRIARVVASQTWMWAHGSDRRIRWLSRLIASPLGKLLYRGLNASPRALVPSAFADRRRLTPAVHRHYVAPFGSWSERAGPWALGVALAGADPYYASLWERRADLAQKPLTLLWAMRDPAFRPDYLARWRAAFPTADVVELPNSGHFPAEEAPDEVASVIRRASRLDAIDAMR